jgi:hypothetical protein
MRMNVAVTGVLGALLVATVLVSIWVWQQIGNTVITLHGMIALGLGVSLTILLAAGLMALVFVSHWRGYDDEAGR